MNQRAEQFVLAVLLCAPCAGAQQLHERYTWPPPRTLDEAWLGDRGLRVLKGEHVTLVTDLAPAPEVDALPQVVDAAVPHWEERFGLAPGGADDWRVNAYLIGEQARFEVAGLMPTGGQTFPHGLSLGYELWVNDQETAYYRRHLLLHEATHSFMSTHLGGCGPGWYMEAMAELLGTHHWDPASGRVELAVMPGDDHDGRALGRIGLLQDAYEAREALSIPAVMRIDNTQALGNESYAWVWALAKLLDAHPRYQERFRALPERVLRKDFNRAVFEAYRDDWSDLQLEWRVMIAGLAYGHDIPREAIEFRPGAPLGASPRTTKVRADRGWQSTGVLVTAGRAYEVDAQGRVIIAREPGGATVQSTSGGVTLDYHAGAPLGVLLAAVDARDAAQGETAQHSSLFAPGGFLRPTRLGRARQYVPEQSGTLYLRLNDSPAELAENSGALRVRISEGAESPRAAQGGRSHADPSPRD